MPLSRFLYNEKNRTEIVRFFYYSLLFTVGTIFTSPICIFLVVCAYYNRKGEICMEFTHGQVFGIEKIEKIFKKTKEQKQKDLDRQRTQELLSRTRMEISTLSDSIDRLYDTEAIESSIYRLKAAQLELNRHIRSAKEYMSKEENL